MSLRVIEIIVPSESASIVREILDENSPIDRWNIAEDHEDDSRVVIRALLDPDYQQSTLDALHDCLNDHEGWRILISPVEAALSGRDVLMPRPANLRATHSEFRRSVQGVRAGFI